MVVTAEIEMGAQDILSPNDTAGVGAGFADSEMTAALEKLTGLWKGDLSEHCHVTPGHGSLSH